MALFLSVFAVALISLLAGWFVGTPRIKALLWRRLPTLPKLLHAKPPEEVLEYHRQQGLIVPGHWLQPIEVASSHVDAEVVEANWLPEVESLSRLAGRFWETIGEQFSHFGTLGQSTLREGLGDRVRAAAWPDEIEDAWDDWDVDDGTTLPLGVSAFFLRDFANRLYEHDTAGFEDTRRELAILAYRWWTRAEADKAFERWLGATLGPVNIGTLKLLWYVEVARAESLKNAAPDYRPYVWLRELLTQPS